MRRRAVASVCVCGTVRLQTPLVCVRERKRETAKATVSKNVDDCVFLVLGGQNRSR